MLNANFTVSPQIGTVLATKFTVVNNTTGDNIDQFIWDFGTGEFVYNETNPVITYNYPDLYTISLTAIDFSGNTSTYSQIVSADLAYRDLIRFTHIPSKFADPGRLTDTPFKFEVISSNPNNPIVVDLFASNSPSTPLQFATDKWNFLTPIWKFLDKDLNPVTSLAIEPIPVYKDGVVVAVSGTGEFYFSDSISTGDPAENCPLLLTVTLQTSGFVFPKDSYIYPYESYANNQTVRAGVVWHVNDLTPTLLKVTGNYISDIQPKQWGGIKIPILITAHANRSDIIPGSNDSISEVLFSYPSSNTTGRQSPVNLTFSNLLTGTYTIDEAPLYFQATDSNNQDSKGYIFTTVTGLTSISATSIVAQTTTTLPQESLYNSFLYPGAYAPNPSVWISNPQRNTLNKITLIPDTGNCNTINYFKQEGILTDGLVQEVPVPAITTTNTFNYNMSGFSGIYSVAVDPRNYDLIAADAEADRLYRFSNDGILLKTFELSSLNDYSANKKMFEFWSWKTKAPSLRSTSFSFYKPSLLSPLNTNYLLQAGGALLPSDYLEIDFSKQVFTVKLSSLVYEPFAEDIDIDIIQIFNPALPTKYTSSIVHWTSASSVSATTFPLTDLPPLSSDPNYYIVSIDGVVQRSNGYTINSSNKTITFSSSIPANTTLTVTYIPSILPPVNWLQTVNYNTTDFYLTGASNQQRFQQDPYSSFLVNIGGVLQSPKTYTFDLNNSKLVFNSSLPQNVPISVTQLTVPENVDIPAAYTPAYISLDKNCNIWVSLFNTVSVLKFDPDFNLLFSTAPTNINWPVESDITPGAPYLAEYEDEFLLKPPTAETDKENNCWVTYANPLCSLLVKYNESGAPILQIPLQQYSIPISLAITPQNNVWVCNTYGSSYDNPPVKGNIQLYDTNTGSVLQTIPNINRPNYLALDRNSNLWFTYGLRRLGLYNTSTNLLTSWTVNSNGSISIPFVEREEVYEEEGSHDIDIVQPFNPLDNQEDEELGGLAIDAFNRVWILDSITNFAYVLSAVPTFNEIDVRSFKILPNNTLGYFIDLNTGNTLIEETEGLRSAQATGDWTGNKWYQKYATFSSLTNRSISGISTPFSIARFENKHQIRRINETFNTAEYYRTLALPEALNVNSTLFNQFFPATVGTGYLSANEDPGQIVYERIANFTLNHTDVDTCNIDQLLSLALQTAVPAADYSAVYPAEILNMLDVASVSRSRLWGVRDDVPILTESIGDEYNTLTDTVTAGTSIILKSRFDSSLSLLQVPPLNNQNIYSITEFKGFGLIEPVTVNYVIYRFNPPTTNNFIENLIDWNSPFTTQVRTASSFNEWYGDGGALETAFRYLLTKNLFPK